MNEKFSIYLTPLLFSFSLLLTKIYACEILKESLFKKFTKFNDCYKLLETANCVTELWLRTIRSITCGPFHSEPVFSCAGPGQDHCMSVRSLHFLRSSKHCLDPGKLSHLHVVTCFSNTVQKLLGLTNPYRY